jgi:hypothetical protein
MVQLHVTFTKQTGRHLRMTVLLTVDLVWVTLQCSLKTVSQMVNVSKQHQKYIEGSLPLDFIPHNDTINAESYSQMLQNMQT